MTGDVEPLVAGSSGSKKMFAEYGLNYTQGTYVDGALDHITCGDERDVSLGFDPKSGGHSMQVHNPDLPRLQASVRATHGTPLGCWCGGRSALL